MYDNLKNEFTDFRLKAAERTDTTDFYRKTLENERASREQADRQVLDLLHDVRNRYDIKLNSYMAKQKKKNNSDKKSNDTSNDANDKTPKDSANNTWDANQQASSNNVNNGWSKGGTDGGNWGSSDNDNKDSNNQDNNNDWGATKNDANASGWGESNQQTNDNDNDWGATEQVANNDDWDAPKEDTNTDWGNTNQDDNTDWGESNDNQTTAGPSTSNKASSWDKTTKSSNDGGWGTNQSNTNKKTNDKSQDSKPTDKQSRAKNTDSSKTDWSNSTETKDKRDTPSTSKDNKATKSPNKDSQDSSKNRAKSPKKKINDEPIKTTDDKSKDGENKKGAKKSDTKENNTQEESNQKISPKKDEHTKNDGVHTSRKDKNDKVDKNESKSETSDRLDTSVAGKDYLEMKSALYTAKLDLRLVERDKSTLKEEISSLTKERDDLTKKLGKACSEQESLRFKVRGLTVDYLNATEDIAKLNARIDTLEAEKRRRDQDTNQGETQRRTMENKYESYVKQIAALQSELSLMKEERDEYKKDAAEFLRRNERLERDLSHSKNLIRTLKDGCALVEDQARTFEVRHDTVVMSKADMERELINIKEESSRHITTINKLQKSNEQISQAFLQSVEAHEQCKDELEVLQAEYSRKLENYRMENVRLLEANNQLQKLVEYVRKKR